MPIICGGVGAPHEPSSEEKEKLGKLLDKHWETHLGRKPQKYDIVQISKQVVSGTNHFVKVKIDDDEYIHARIFEPLPCHGTELTLHSIQKDKKKDDALTFF